MSFRSIRSRRVCFALSLVTALGAFASGSKDAQASGYLAARFGSDHGTPAMANAYAIYFNPAAMGGTKGTAITGDLAVLYRSASYTRTPDALSLAPTDGNYSDSYAQANTGKGKIGNILALPFLGVTSDLGTRDLRVGYAAYLPFGGLANWTRKDQVAGAPGSEDGPQRWHNISGEILAIYNTLAVSYTIDPLDLTVGASGSVVIHRVKTVRARNGDGSDATVAAGTQVEGRSYLEASGMNAAASFGLYWAPKRLAGYTMKKRFRLGLSYISQPGFGTTRMKGELEQALATSKPDKQPVEFLQEYPDVVRLGFAHRFPSDKLELRGDLEYVRWSVFKNQCVIKADTPTRVNGNCDVDDTGTNAMKGNQDIILNLKRDWKDAYGARFGVAYWPKEELEVFGSMGVTTPAVPTKSIDAGTIDSVRLYPTIGARYEFSEHFALGGSYNHIIFMPVTATDSHYNKLGPDSVSPSANGKYSSTIGFVNVNATYTF
jgi:long-chain fatty acid transport protein